MDKSGSSLYYTTKFSSPNGTNKLRSFSTPLTELPTVKRANIANQSIDTQNKGTQVPENSSLGRAKQIEKANKIAPLLNHANISNKQEKYLTSVNRNERKNHHLLEVGTGKQSQKSENFRSLKEVKEPSGEGFRKNFRLTTKEDKFDAYQLVKQDSKQTKAGPVFTISNYHPAKCSAKGHGLVKAYAAATNQGDVRDYNEDRVSVFLKINPPSARAYENWPKCSFFAVYDGHGGSKCAEYLKDHLHELVINDPAFPRDPIQALSRGIEAAENEFSELAQQLPSGEIDRSGSCAIVALIVGNTCYIANVGDSRAIMSSDNGMRVSALSNDHKPMEHEERRRITTTGGQIYQSKHQTSSVGDIDQEIIRPYRVYPGRLSVSRTIGDIQAKHPKYGGNPNCVIATPEIKTFQLTQDCDFIVLASDGVFDVLSNEEVSDAIWNSFNNFPLADSIHKQAGIGADSVLQESILQGTFDNVTVVVIAFENLSNKLFPKQPWQTNKENNPHKSKNLWARVLKGSSDKKNSQGFTQTNQSSLQRCPQIFNDSSVKDKKNPSSELSIEKPNSNRGSGSQKSSLTNLSEIKAESAIRNKLSSLRKECGDQYLLSQAMTKTKSSQRTLQSNPISLNELPENFYN